jgi:hypothetical protein
VEISPECFFGKHKEFVDKLPLQLFLITLSNEDAIMDFLEGLERLLAAD